MRNVHDWPARNVLPRIGRAPAAWTRLLRRIDLEPLPVWALAAGTVLYLGIDGGGYDEVVHSHVAIVVWWIVLVGASWKLLPAAKPTRWAWAGLASLGAFVAWTALAGTWSLSSERSLQSLSLVAGYLGMLVLALALHRERERAIRHTLGAVASAIVIVACLALASRLDPGLFTGARQTASFLPDTQGRLGWPLNYWNALAALLALGLPLLLALATSSAQLRVQAAAAAAIPLVALCGYLTFSRGGALAAAAALLTFFVLAHDRLPKLASLLACAVGSVGLIAAAAHRSAIERGLANAAATRQGATLGLALMVVCAGVGLCQLGIGLILRQGVRPRLLIFSPRRARALLVGGIVAAAVAAAVAGAPGRLSHAWRQFKHPTAAVLGQDVPERFAALSGNGRYDMWRVAVQATRGHVLDGSGPGTYEFQWLLRAPYFSYIQNAHSLYLETLSEVGVVGLFALCGFLLVAIGAGVKAAVRSPRSSRSYAAAAAAAMLAFAVAGAYDWIWQVPAVPAVFMLLAAAVLAPRVMPKAARAARISGTVRGGMIVLAISCLIVIGVPLAATTAVRRSQAASTSGDPLGALTAAREAVRLEPGAASPQIQLALVLERRRAIAAALAAALRATADEPKNWSTWLVLSRLQAEAGHPQASLGAYTHARTLNPRSPLFRP